MFQQYFSLRKSKIAALAGGLVLLVLLLLAWRFVSLQRAASKAATEPVLKISYCGADLEELCILSFGRDVEENMVVNLFVPDRKFPAFYLEIKRATSESVYECERDREVRTSVFCFGEMVNLQEKMEISLFSMDDERLIAAGSLTLNALLISLAQAQGQGEAMTTALPATTSPTPPDTFVSPTANATLSVTPTITPPSYPSYP